MTAPHTCSQKPRGRTLGLQPTVRSHRRQRRFTSLGVTEQQMLPEVKRMFLSFTAAPPHVCLRIKTQARPSRLLHPAAIITLQLKICCCKKRKISSGGCALFRCVHKNQERNLNFPQTLRLSVLTLPLSCVSSLKFITWWNESGREKKNPSKVILVHTLQECCRRGPGAAAPVRSQKFPSVQVSS